MKAKTKLLATEILGFASVVLVIAIYKFVERRWGGYEAVGLAILLLIPVAFAWRYLRFRYFEEEHAGH